MTEQKKQKFSWRAFTSLYVTFSFLIMIVSGLILYIAPAGRIAKWIYIPILGLEKDQWQAIHTIFTFLFIIASGFHLYFNWEPFMFYLRKKVKQEIKIRKEFIFSLIVTLLIFLATLIYIPPFSSVMELGEYFKDGWEKTQNEPPVPHAEELTIAELSKIMKIPVQRLVNKLQSFDIQVEDENIVLNDLAEKYGLSPQKIYQKLMVKEEKTRKEKSREIVRGRGYGRKTLAEVCEQLNIPLEEALIKLKAMGTKASSNTNIKELAAKLDKTPIEVINLLK